MANKSYYYVMIFTEEGPKFVTSMNRATKMAHWDKDKSPKLFTMHDADDLVFGLRCNMFYAVTVKSGTEIENQPYNYADYECTFVKREKEDGEKQP